MNSIILTDKEINKINTFVKEASNIPALECIFMIPYQDREHNEIVDIYIYINTSDHYNGLLYGKEEYRNTLEEEDNIGELIYNTYLDPEKDRLLFKEISLNSFCVPSVYAQELYKRYLANGIIIFDRFGEKTAYREELLNDPELIQYDNIFKIDNIDSILNSNENSLKLSNGK